MVSAGNFFEPVGTQRREPVGKSEMPGISCRRGERVLGQVHAGGPCVCDRAEQRQRDRAGAGAEIEDAALSPALGNRLHEGQDGVDQRLRVRARLQRLRRQEQPQPVEFTVAENAMRRFAGETPRQRGLHRLHHRRCSRFLLR